MRIGKKGEEGRDFLDEFMRVDEDNFLPLAASMAAFMQVDVL